MLLLVSLRVILYTKFEHFALIRFLSYAPDKQTDKQTNKQTRTFYPCQVITQIETRKHEQINDDNDE